MLKMNLVDQIQHGEPAEKAIPSLREEYAGLIYNLGLRLCHSPESAQDLVQETFLRAFHNWHQFEGRSSPATWLFTIAMRTHKLVCRRLKGRHQVLGIKEATVKSRVLRARLLWREGLVKPPPRHKASLIEPSQ